VSPESTGADEQREGAVNAHYGRAGTLDAILAALRAAGKDVEALTTDDLAPVDQFHTGGKAATLALAGLARLAPGLHVLDVGGGIGGAARLLAREHGCRVTVVDLTEEYCRVGAELTRRTGLADRVDFRHGDALALPFPSESFDVAWTQHSTMNIADKVALYREIHRVVRPGGRYAFHEIATGPAGLPPRFPVPWARDPAVSALAPPDDLRRLLADAGFTETAWLDLSAEALAWFRARAAAAQGGPMPALGLHLLLGGDLGAMLANVTRSLDEGRIAVVQGVTEHG
jgi:SAM-dependent methyltransferase